MDGAGFKLLELILLPGAIFAWGFWELYKLERDKKEREARKKAEAARGQRDEDSAGSERR